MRIVMIGAGNVATNLVHSLSAHHQIIQIFSRTMESASVLAVSGHVENYTDDLAELRTDADIYVISVKDAYVTDVARCVRARCADALIVHTAGSLPMSCIPEGRRGVLYPMQTFSKQRLVDFSQIPVFIEASSAGDLSVINDLASSLSRKVVELSSENRRYLHVAAVLLCNFSNHLATLAYDVLGRHDIPFDVMLPLLDETVRKLHHMKPFDAQTGPAVRKDMNVMDSQRELLSAEPDGDMLRRLYDVLSQSIIALHDGRSV